MRKRLRSTIKWGCTVVTVLLLIVWVGSVWCEVSSGSCSISAGRLNFSWFDGFFMKPTRDDLWFEAQPARFDWWFRVESGNHFNGHTGLSHTSAHVCLPIWSFAVLSGLPAMCLFYIDRRRAPGLCAKCGYDLRGAEHAVCPECGNG